MTATPDTRAVLQRLLEAEERAHEIYTYARASYAEDRAAAVAEGFTYQAEKLGRSVERKDAEIARAAETMAALRDALTHYPEQETTP